MRRAAGHLLSALLGAALLAFGLWYTLETPMVIQLQVYPLRDSHPLRINGWCPLQGTEDGVWWSWPAVEVTPSAPCEDGTPSAPAQTTPATLEGSST